MSLRLKIPRKSTEDASPSPSQYNESGDASTPNHAQPQTRSSRQTLRSPIRKAAKRRVDSEDEGEEEECDTDPLNITPTTRRRISTMKRARTEIAPHDSNTESPVEVEPETRFLPESTSSSSAPISPENATSPNDIRVDDGKLKRAGSKKQLVVESEDEDDDGEYEAPASPGQTPDGENDDKNYVKGWKRPKAPVKQKSVGKGNTTKGPRGKSSKENKEIVDKDERQPGPGQENPNDSTNRPPNVSRTDTETVVDVIGETAKTPERPTIPVTEPTKEPTPPAAPPKKRKLPPIKKIKTSGSVALSSAVPQKLPGKGDVGETPKAPARTPAASIGNADFDLRKPSVYAELFKSAGGNTPRSGLNRREKDEERRKELNRMRDEARAKRATESKDCFDLQRQSDKISRFEEKLRQARSSVLYPNFLGAKFKDDLERQRRKDAERGQAHSRKNT